MTTRDFRGSTERNPLAEILAVETLESSSVNTRRFTAAAGATAANCKQPRPILGVAAKRLQRVCNETLSLHVYY
jgi:hypothetical protein